MNVSQVYISQLDILFPYVCLAYGALMTLVLSSRRLSKLAEDRFPAPMVAQWRAHRGLALICLVVGAAWVLQNIWLT